MTDNFLIYNLCELFHVEPTYSFDLPEKISYEQAVNIYDNFYKMYEYFLRTKNMLIFLKPTHIMVINDSLFLPTNQLDMCSYHNTYVNIYEPYDKTNPYISNVLKLNEKLPFHTDANLFMESVSILLLNLLGNDLDSIYGTPLYWNLYNNLYA